MASSGDPRGYYRALGVDRGATPEEIRAAFRERAKVLHPDRSPGDEDDNGFREPAEAYAVLRDPRRRLLYDGEGLTTGLGAASERPRGARMPHDPLPQSEAEGLRRRGERPQRLEPLPSPQPAPPVGWIAAVAALALLAALGAGVSWRLWAGLGDRDAQLAELTGRFETLAAAERELRGRLDAQTMATIADAASGAISGELAGRAVFARDIPFQPGSAELDRPLEIIIDSAVVGLSRALRNVPTDQPWLVVVEGYAGSAADENGVAVAPWEIALLRLGAVVERLLAQGLPQERLATRFHAGFASGHDTSVVELKLICCTR